jgi:predicted ATPase
MNTEIRKYVITGGPCSGKTTTLDALSKYGNKFLLVSEAARKVIEEELKNGKRVITWQGDVHERQSKILDMQLKLEKEAEYVAREQGKDIIFFDRGVPDGIAFYKISNTKLLKKLLEESKPEKRDYAKIFFLESIPYRTDSVRKEPQEIAKRITELTYDAYKSLGYKILVVPAMSVQARVKFIKENL